MALSTRTSAGKRLPGPRDARLRYARTCYNHLAGTLGVQLFAYLRQQGWIISDANGWMFSADGAEHFGQMVGGPIKHTSLGRSCLDWSERREHLGGALGKAVLAVLVENELVRIGTGRLVEPTATGLVRLAGVLG